MSLDDEATGSEKGQEFSPLDPSSVYPTNVRNAASKKGNLHVVEMGLVDIASLAEAGLLRNPDRPTRREYLGWQLVSG